ncbi:MAG TPA: UDP-N-acetylmuramoyl-L-alanyl-D-glutamate--2,6-diaminopimelate ligase [Rubricoccaceae bacterium]|nr:UDP-N-acetylmuramoyl-L-alanyl-D-glutamate--2,6-diaminopimelate ligase [Rubricoccaceae bacterium]
MGAPRSFPFEPDVPPAPLAGLLAPLRAAGLLAAPDREAIPEEAGSLLIHRLADDSRAVTPGTLFVARSGDHTDGHLFLDTAVQNGAVAAVVSAEWYRDRPNSLGNAAAANEPLGKGERLPGAACVLVPVTDTRAALGELANAFYGAPSRHLDLLGVTGTNGKTTTAFLLYRLLTALGVRAGLVGTVENRIGERRVETAYTTPEAIELNALLRAMVDAGCGACAMEVSSHGLALDRVRAQRFRAGVFTNLTHDHLDFHPSFEHYRAAKKRLFDGLDDGAVAVVNRDDAAWAEMVADTMAPVVTYGTDPAADVRVEVLENALDGLRLRLDGAERTFRLAGGFNAYNLAAAYAVGRALGYGRDEVLDVLAEAPGVPGRFETVRSDDGVLGVVDYAHTPDALENVLRTARGMMGEGQRLWAVFGCGGDRDRAKRPVMGRLAEALADRVVLTSDNPRGEDPDAILAEIRSGLTNPDAAAVIPDRAAAIAHAAARAAPGDVVVVAGKGHEDYQIVGAEKRPFDDRRELRAAFDRRAN